MTTTMKEVYGRLRDVGINKTFLRDVALPSWWEPKVADSPAGLDHTLLILSRRLGFSYDTLKKPGEPLQGTPQEVRFKANVGVEQVQLEIPAALGSRIAKLVLRGTTSVSNDPFAHSDPSQLRQKILSTNAPWVGLRELTSFCWSIGVPVIHLRKLPKSTEAGKVRAPAGMAIRVGQRYAIVLCRNDKYESKHLFNLAHELGHIALGHVDGDLIVDADLDEQNSEQIADPQEQAANSYALSLLCGSEAQFEAGRGGLLKAHELARAALHEGTKRKIAPGHIALNYGHTMTKKMKSSFYPTAHGALSELGEGQAPEMLRSMVDLNVQWDELSDDDEEFVRKALDVN